MENVYFNKMLVHAKDPYGQTKIEHRKFYGEATNHGPQDVPYEFYQNYKHYLVGGTYRDSYLKKHFRGPFPTIAFKLKELRHLPRKTLETLAYGMTIHFDDNTSIGSLVKSINWKLRPCLDH